MIGTGVKPRYISGVGREKELNIKGLPAGAEEFMPLGLGERKYIYIFLYFQVNPGYNYCKLCMYCMTSLIATPGQIKFFAFEWAFMANKGCSHGARARHFEEMLMHLGRC